MTLFELGSLSLSVAKPTSRNKPQAKCQKADAFFGEEMENREGQDGGVVIPPALTSD
jgi:hypothetical protein